MDPADRADVPHSRSPLAKERASGAHGQSGRVDGCGGSGSIFVGVGPRRRPLAWTVSVSQPAGQQPLKKLNSFISTVVKTGRPFKNVCAGLILGW